MIETVMGMLTGITITALIVGLVVILVTMETRTRRLRQKMMHDERMMAIEKGLPVPADYAETIPHRRPYVRGLVTAAAGVGIMIFGLFKGVGPGHDYDLIGIGTIPLLVGLALIIGDRIAESRKAKTSYPGAGSTYPPPGSPS
jgi:hypothetical protein